MITKEPAYLYKEYQEYIELAEKYKDYQFVYIGINGYNHIKNMPEFMTYKESLILSEEQIEILKKREFEDTFILSIKAYYDFDKVLNQVLEYTNSDNYELLFEGRALGYEANYYLIY